jgi:hypothetical protein
MAAYLHEPFTQADSLLTGLLESYRSSTDASDVADIQKLVETTVKIARDREFRAQSLIKELSSKVAAAETAAVYTDAKAQHEQKISEINNNIADMQQSVQLAREDIVCSKDQQLELQTVQKQLQADRQRWMQQEQDPEPLVLRLISMYAHISGMSFDYSTLDKPVTKAEVTGFIEAGIRNISIDRQQSAYDAVNKLWDQIPCPKLE